MSENVCVAMENHSKFLNRLRPFMTERQLVITDWAYINAKYGHRNQRRDSGERYFEHLRAVALILINELEIYEPEMIQAALMHDMLEDSYLLDAERIEALFSPTVSTMVTTLSMPPIDLKKFRSKQERLDFYHSQIKEASVEVKIIKLCDRLHNCRTLNSCVIKKRRHKMEETIVYYLPLIKDVKEKKLTVGETLEKAFEEAIANLEL